MEPVSYEIIPSDRRTLSLQIRPDGTVLVRCPRGYPRQKIRQFVESRRAWITGHLQAIASRPREPSLTPEELEVLRRQAQQVFPRRTAYFAPLVGVTYGNITVRMQKTRWGSCSSQGNLNFNLLLLLAPPEVLDYVVVHELCHRKEMNHSPRFWAEVRRVLPDYKDRVRWLKEQGGALMLRAEAVRHG